jgi:hypothetical protein
MLWAVTVKHCLGLREMLFDIFNHSPRLAFDGKLFGFEFSRREFDLNAYYKVECQSSTLESLDD